MVGDKGNTSASAPEGSLFSHLLRPMAEQSELDRPYVPIIAGPRLFILLLYASVLIVASIEFFVDMRIWYGSWDVYNTYLFIVSGLFVLLGMLMLFSSRRIAPDEYKLPLPRIWFWIAGLVMLAGGGLGLVVGGKSLEGWAIVLSVLLVYGFVLMVFGTKSIDVNEGMRLSTYGTGLILMILVPVHESFNVARSPSDEWFFALPNLVLLIAGMTISLISLQSLKSKDGFLGAWLMGAMVIFLIAFHEQIGIVASRTISEYDRALAMIGITFSFLPLMMYVWRENVYFFLWRRLRISNALIAQGDYKGALKHAEEALKQCYRAGIEDRFSMPWTLKADALYRMKDYPKARVSYETALQIEPRDSVSWAHLGNMYAFEGKQEQALKAFEEAIKADSRSAFAWNNKGAVYQSLRMDEDALICFDKALQYAPTSFDAHFNMARLLARLGHSDEALPHYQAALELRPDSEAAKEGIRKEYFKNICMDQILGWEQLGLDTTGLRQILEQDAPNFVKRSKEFLANIVDQRTQLPLVPWKQHLDVTAAIQKILKVTEPPGASIERIQEETHLKTQDLVLPLALLMETDHVYFKTVGRKEVYVSEGKAPEKPPEVVVPKEAEPTPAVEAARPLPTKPVVVPIKCPGCGHVLKGDETKCPMCDLPLESASFDCPICSEEVAFSADSCPKCGAIFRGVPVEAKELEKAVEEAAKEQPKAEEKARRIWPRRKKAKRAAQKPKKAPPPEEKKRFRRPPPETVEPTASILFFRRKKKT